MPVNAKKAGRSKNRNAEIQMSRESAGDDTIVRDHGAEEKCAEDRMDADVLGRQGGQQQRDEHQSDRVTRKLVRV